MAILKSVKSSWLGPVRNRRFFFVFIQIWRDKMPKKRHSKFGWIIFCLLFSSNLSDNKSRRKEGGVVISSDVLVNQCFVVGLVSFCYSDIFPVFFSCSYRSIGRFCGRKRPSDVISPDSCLKMVFHSDSAVARRGFKARLIVTARPQNLASLPLHSYRLVAQFPRG